MFVQIAVILRPTLNSTLLLKNLNGQDIEFNQLNAFSSSNPTTELGLSYEDAKLAFETRVFELLTKKHKTIEVKAQIYKTVSDIEKIQQHQGKTNSPLLDLTINVFATKWFGLTRFDEAGNLLKFNMPNWDGSFIEQNAILQYTWGNGIITKGNQNVACTLLDLLSNETIEKIKKHWGTFLESKSYSNIEKGSIEHAMSEFLTNSIIISLVRLGG